ncbi:MAG: hypothetical protein NDJ92_02465 [Thermoanaerobaculia bacterium]|nr:hypothetical protein [Thermoanaerobaculia bacterium]
MDDAAETGPESRARAASGVGEDYVAARSATLRRHRGLLAFAVILLAWLVVATAARIHGSSVAAWNSEMNRVNRPDFGILLGTPRMIRSDDWTVGTPFIMSQALQPDPFPTVNTSLGAKQSPMLLNVPVRHWSVLFKPHLLGFFVLDLERAYALMWQLKVVGLLLSAAMLIYLLTEERLGIALLGSAWILFSSFTQWWFSTQLPESLTALFAAMSFAMLLPGEKALGWRIVQTCGLIYAAVAFSVLLYPPFQIQLLYLALAVVMAWMWQLRGREKVWRRAVPAWGGAGLLCAFLLGLWLWELRDSFAAMAATSYPGARESAGGDLPSLKLFSGFFNPLMSEASVPDGWLNVCESSSYLLLFPVLLVATAVRWRRGRRPAPMQIALASYCLGFWLWNSVEFSAIVGRYTGLGQVHGNRGFLGIGIASILWCCVELAGASRDGELVPRSSRRTVLVCLGVAAAYALAMLRATPGFFEMVPLAICSIWAALLAASLWLGRARPFAALLLPPLVAVYGLVNPVAQGLQPITESRLYSTVRTMVQREPRAMWAASDRGGLAEYLMSAGAVVVNGTKFIPPVEQMSLFDVGGRQRFIYNRYAHAYIESGNETAEPYFELRVQDQYVLHLPLRPEPWRRLGVRYLASGRPLPPSALAAHARLMHALPESKVWIYDLGR